MIAILRSLSLECLDGYINVLEKQGESNDVLTSLILDYRRLKDDLTLQQIAEYSTAIESAVKRR
jgi:hypothetical protein